MRIRAVGLPVTRWFTAAASAACAAVVAQVRCRTLLVHGRQDAIPETVAYEIREAMPQLELRFIEKSGHFSWIEQPEQTLRVLRAFLAPR
jgi:pimeloyl-ACP methyl ester carboxylesterase